MGKLSRKFTVRRCCPKSLRTVVKACASPYPTPPPELAGKWVAWSRDHRIVASDDSLDVIMDVVERAGIKGVSFERLPELDRVHVH